MMSTKRRKRLSPEQIVRKLRDAYSDHLAFLLQLCERELLEQERKAGERRLKAARF